MAIVKGFKVVNINGQYGQVSFKPLGAPDFSLNGFLTMTSVKEAG